MSIFPVFLFSLLHATTYTKKVLDVSIRQLWLLLMILIQNEVTCLLIIKVIVVLSLFDLFFSLQSMGPNSLMFIRNLLDKLGSNQQNILKFIACNEIFLMPATVFMLFRYNLFAWIFSCPVAQNIILNHSERMLCCDFFFSYNSVMSNTFH